MNKPADAEAAEGEEPKEEKVDPLANLEQSIEEVIQAREEEHLDEEQKDGISKELRLQKTGECFA